MVNKRRHKKHKSTFEPMHVMYAKTAPEISFNITVIKSELITWCEDSMVEECYYAKQELDGLVIMVTTVSFNDHGHAALFKMTFL